MGNQESQHSGSGSTLSSPRDKVSSPRSSSGVSSTSTSSVSPRSGNKKSSRKQQQFNEDLWMGKTFASREESTLMPEGSRIKSASRIRTKGSTVRGGSGSRIRSWRLSLQIEPNNDTIRAPGQRRASVSSCKFADDILLELPTQSRESRRKSRSIKRKPSDDPSISSAESGESDGSFKYDNNTFKLSQPSNSIITKHKKSSSSESNNSNSSSPSRPKRRSSKKVKKSHEVSPDIEMEESREDDGGLLRGSLRKIKTRKSATTN